MVRAAIKEASELQRKSFVPDEQRTPDRDELADWIESKIIDTDERWLDWTILKIATEAGWSREHVARVLDSYFEPAGTPDQGGLEQLVQEIPRPDGSDDYESGYRAGFNDGMKWVIEHRDVLEDLTSTE